MRLVWSSHARKRMAQGALASVGAPLGWLLLEWASGVPPFVSYVHNAGLYSYMLFGTMLVFSAFGFYVGNHEASSWALAIRDPLTGAFNRRYFEARLTEELARFHRNQQRFALACLDIDHFKRVNDTYGHATGDVVLRGLVSCISQDIRGLDVLARIGGEEFFILMPTIDQQDAEKAMQRLLGVIRAHQFIIDSGDRLHITVSIGLTMLRENDTLPALMERADKAMYKAKQSGRDRLVSD